MHHILISEYLWGVSMSDFFFHVLFPVFCDHLRDTGDKNTDTDLNPHHLLPVVKSYNSSEP